MNACTLSKPYAYFGNAYFEMYLQIKAQYGFENWKKNLIYLYLLEMIDLVK